MNFLLASADFNFGHSLLVFLIGMLVIFFVLATLVLTVMAVSGFFRIGDKISSKKKAKQVEVKAEQPVSAVSNDAEIVAAITAAISMIYASESECGEVPPFRVKSIIQK